MPKNLKEQLRARIDERAKELGRENFTDMIADETCALTQEEVLAYLEKVGHPALKMESMV